MAKVVLVECRVLTDCPHGNWGDVVEVEKSVALSTPFLDPHPDAVAAAKAALAEKQAATPAAA